MSDFCGVIVIKGIPDGVEKEKIIDTIKDSIDEYMSNDGIYVMATEDWLRQIIEGVL